LDNVNSYHDIRVNVFYDELADIFNCSFAVIFECPDLAGRVIRWLRLDAGKQCRIPVVDVIGVTVQVTASEP